MANFKSKQGIQDPARPVRIETESLSFSYIPGGRLVLKDVSLTFQRGMFYSIIGPNGSGKSTLIKTMSKIITPPQGGVFINGRDICGIHHKSLSKIMTVIPQNINIEAEFTVSEIVMMGRSPYKRRFQDFDSEDEAIAEKAMRATNTWDFKDMLITQLSGGEVQRVVAARALCQETDIILLDEPTSHLDLQYQLEFLKFFKSLKTNKIIIAVLHDLNLASMFSDEIILLHQGRVTAIGSPEEVVTRDNIRSVYNITADVVKNPMSDCPYVIPMI